MNILFVCKYNRFRSKVAEAYFKKVNKDSDAVVKGAGLIPKFDIDAEIFDSVKKSGLEISLDPIGVDYNLIRWADKIIIVASNIPIDIFEEVVSPESEVIHWEIQDAEPGDMNGRESVIKNICG